MNRVVGIDYLKRHGSAIQIPLNLEIFGIQVSGKVLAFDREASGNSGPRDP